MDATHLSDDTVPVEEPNAVYRFYDAQDRLLYIGVSMNLLARWKAHDRQKDWWRQVVRATIEHFDTREAALEAEETAIRTEKPLYNVTHNQPARVPSPRPEPIPIEDIDPADIITGPSRARSPLHWSWGARPSTTC